MTDVVTVNQSRACGSGDKQPLLGPDWRWLIVQAIRYQ